MHKKNSKYNKICNKCDTNYYTKTQTSTNTCMKEKHVNSKTIEEKLQLQYASSTKHSVVQI